MNITLSAMNRLQLWSTEVEATQEEWTNTYYFHQPTRLILSYFVALALALPFLILGFVALVRSGANAPSGGLVDMLVLGAKSRGITEAAKGISLERGDMNERKELENLKVRYGRIADPDESADRMGLATEHELRDAKE